MSEGATVTVQGKPHPDPIPTRDSAFFWEAAKRGELVSRRCAACGYMDHPPLPMCPRCHGLAWTEVKLSGRGEVTGWMKVHHPPTPLFDYPIPVVTARLEEGLTLVSNLVDLGDAEPHVGLSVEVAFAPTISGAAVPVFRPA